jgi:hypothetical protein
MMVQSAGHREDHQWKLESLADPASRQRDLVHSRQGPEAQLIEIVFLISFKTCSITGNLKQWNIDVRK